MYQIKPICIRVLLPFKSFIHLRANSMASGLQLCPSSWVTQPSSGFPRNLLLFIMHGTPLDYCRRRTLHYCSLQREAETDWRMGSGFKKTPIRMGYPTVWVPQLIAFCLNFKYKYGVKKDAHVLRLLANFVVIRLWINFILIHSNQRVSLLKFQPEGIYAANSLV